MLTDEEIKVIAHPFIRDAEPAWRCKGCKHVYQQAHVDCDCGLPQANDYEPCLILTYDQAAAMATKGTTE